MSSTNDDDDRFLEPLDLASDPMAETKATCPLCEGLGMLTPTEYLRCKATIAKLRKAAPK